jgi:hypothetical protein
MYNTTIVDVLFPLVDQHEKKLKVRICILIENFGIHRESTKGFEKGNTFFCDMHLFITYVFNISTLEINVQAKFHHVYIILEFHKQSHEIDLKPPLQQ